MEYKASLRHRGGFPRYEPLHPSSEEIRINDTDSDKIHSLPLPNHRPRQELKPDADAKRHVYLNPRQRATLVTGLFLLALITRFYNISEPHSVVFDEVHFGGFASKYIQRLFFFDVHPPTGKLLYAFAGWLAGYDGTFSFKEIHMDYVKYKVPYVALRALPALCGSLLVPLAFLTVNGMGYSVVGATLAACMVLFENSLVTQSRFILLDMPMLLFIALAVYCYTQFRLYWAKPFTQPWWTWLLLSGVNLGLAVSVKWVGLFIIAFIGLQTLSDLWVLLGEHAFGRYRPISMAEWGQHFSARAACLIFAPITVYVISYWIHFSVLSVQGPGTAFMPAAFKDGLMVPVADPQKGIDSSAQVTVLALGAQGNPFLHSHPHVYPLEHSSGQQQVTAYGFEDHNNWLVFSKSQQAEDEDGDQWLRDGNTVHISHVATERGLFVHGYPAPVSKPEGNESLYEVSANDGEGHMWRIQLTREKPKDGTKGGLLEKADSFRLFHDQMGCVLTATQAKLPDWGFHQSEVVCTTNLARSDAILQVADFHNMRQSPYKDLLPAKTDRSGLFSRLKDIIDIQVIQWNVNQRLTATHVFQSRPEAWPIMNRGISYWQDNGHRRQVYLFGNPLIFWVCLCAPPLYLLVALFLTLRMQRQCYDLDKFKLERFMLVGFLWTGYLLHYLPFFLMERQLFFHHYLPAHYFMILAVAAFFDLLANWTIPNPKIRIGLVAILVAVFFASFLYYAPLTYATPISVEGRDRRKWVKSWDFM